MRKRYSDDMGRFPVCSRNSNYFIMLAYHVECNVILVKPFQSRHDRHRLAAADRIMTRFDKNGHAVDLLILDNECSAAYKLQIEEKWNATFQLVPPDMHRRNITERMIQTFKSHFLSIIAGVSAIFPKFLWDKLLLQTGTTLNLIC